MRLRWKNSGTLTAESRRGLSLAAARPMPRARCSSIRAGGAITKRQRAPPAARHSISTATRARPKLSSHQPEE